MDTSYENTIQSAIADYSNAIARGKRAATAAYYIPQSTFRGRLASRVLRIEFGPRGIPWRLDYPTEFKRFSA